MKVHQHVRVLLSSLLLLGFLFSLAGKELHDYTGHEEVVKLCEFEGGDTHFHAEEGHHQDCDLFHIKVAEYSAESETSSDEFCFIVSAINPVYNRDNPASLHFSTKRLRAPPAVA